MLAFLCDAYSLAYGLVNALLIRLTYPAATCLLFLAAEWALPHNRNSIASYRRAAVFWAAAIAFNTLVLKALEGTMGALRIPPLAELDLRERLVLGKIKRHDRASSSDVDRRPMFRDRCPSGNSEK